MYTWISLTDIRKVYPANVFIARMCNNHSCYFDHLKQRLTGKTCLKDDQIVFYYMGDIHAKRWYFPLPWSFHDATLCISSMHNKTIIIIGDTTQSRNLMPYCICIWRSLWLVVYKLNTQSWNVIGIGDVACIIERVQPYNILGRTC